MSQNRKINWKDFKHYIKAVEDGVEPIQNDEALDLHFPNTHIHITEHTAKGTLDLDADGDSNIHVDNNGVEIQFSGTLESNTEAVLEAVEEQMAAFRLSKKSKNQTSISPQVSSETMIYGYPDKDYQLQYKNWADLSSKGHGDVSIEVQTKNNKKNVSINFYSYENTKYSPGMFSLRSELVSENKVAEVQESIDNNYRF